MTAGNTIAIAVIVAFAIAAIAAFAMARRHPENAASHGVEPVDESTEFFGRVNDRPAGPGAEADGVAAPGEPVPGPSAASLRPARSEERRA